MTNIIGRLEIIPAVEWWLITSVCPCWDCRARHNHSRERTKRYYLETQGLGRTQCLGQACWGYSKGRSRVQLRVMVATGWLSSCNCGCFRRANRSDHMPDQSEQQHSFVRQSTTAALVNGLRKRISIWQSFACRSIYVSHPTSLPLPRLGPSRIGHFDRDVIGCTLDVAVEHVWWCFSSTSIRNVFFT